MTDSIWLTMDNIWLLPSLALAAGAIAARLNVFFKRRWGGVRAGAVDGVDDGLSQFYK
jgi:hypothetical protein